jgi:CO/xanthine dehydrogenase FAD-binding subunit
MICEYHRPASLEEALALLARPHPPTIPLGGGTAIDRRDPQEIAVVDLQALGLARIELRGQTLLLGAAATLQALLETPGIPAALQDAIQLEATYNLRQAATVAGTLVAAGGRSPFAAALLALDARLTLEPGAESVELGELLLSRPARLRGRLITQVSLPLNARLGFHSVARTPADLPIVCAALARWPSGRTRLALGGYGAAPLMALDGPEPGGAEEAARQAYSQAGDEWASAEYRSDVAGTLARRLLAE